MRRLQALAGALAGAVLLAGCVDLPVSGPVVESGARVSEDARRASDIDARPPAKGASRTEVVTGFLDAMTAWPVQTNVAKQFLTKEAAGQWDPERQTLVYSDSLPPQEVGGEVTVQLTSADRLDDTGAWRGAVAPAGLSLRFRVTVEDGEYRITDPRDALVVPTSWFQQRFRQVSLYYFDPIAQILVPEPVFVPLGDQLATSLVTALLAGPPPRVRRVVRTFLPAGLSVGLSVPVDDDGVAEITLVGDAPRTSPEEAELMLAQLAWTLRQDRDITAFRVTIGGVDVPLPGGASQYPVSAAEAFNPAGASSSGLLFGLSQGRLYWGSTGSLVPVTGPFGDEGRDLLAVAAAPDASRAAAVDQDGRRLVTAPVRERPGADVRTVVAGTAFARPTWDNSRRLWVLDRRPGGAVVWSVERGRVRQLDVPGVTGERARHLLVSRDGTRLVAVVRTAAGDQVVGVRLVIDGRGRIARVVAPFVVRPADGTRIHDLAWTSPISLALLTQTAAGALYEVDVVAADGASVGLDSLSTVVSGRVRGIAGSPTPDAPTFAVFSDRYLDVVTQEEYGAGSAPLRQLDYAG